MPLRRFIRRFRRSQLGGLAQDTGYVALWQASSMAAILAQTALITHAFGLSGYGQFVVAVAFVELVGGCFNLRVGIAGTTFGARWLVQDPRVAAGVFQYGFLIDMITTLAGMGLLAVLALAAGSHLAGSGAAALILVYALALAGHACTRSAFVVLRLLDRFALIATYSWVFELGRVALVAAAILLFDGLMAVVVAVVIATLAAGATNVIVAATVFRRTHGLALSRSHVSDLERDERRAMRSTMFHTLVISYSRVVQTQLPTVLLSVIAGTTQAGIYKVGMAAAAAVGKLIDPATNALLPRLSRLWAAGRMSELRRLIFRASLVTAPVIVAAFATVVIFQDAILQFLGGGPAGEAARTVLLLGAATQALYGLVFWRGTLLLAAGKARVVSRVGVGALVVHLPALLVLVPTLEANGAALALLISQTAVSVALTTVAVRTLASARDRPIERRAVEPAL